MRNRYQVQKGGSKVSDAETQDNVRRAITALLKSKSAASSNTRPKFTTVSIHQDEDKRQLLFSLMDT